jgi:hypothetical protein
MRSGLFRIIGITIALFGLSLGVATNLKLKPHALVSLDIPISLSPGHIKTGDFSVEPWHLYYVDVDLGNSRPHKRGCEPTTVLATRWELTSKTGHVEGGTSPWEDSGLTIAVFCPDERRYSFHAQVSSGADCLNSANPRLKVRTHPGADDLYTALAWASALLITVGIVIFFLPSVQQRSQGYSMMTLVGSPER